MKHLNKRAKKTFLSLINGMVEHGDHRKIENSGGTFMAVSVDFLRSNKFGDVYSIAHNYTQNGDLMCDPDMEFLYACDLEVYPMTFQQDGIGLYQRALWIDDGRRKMCRDKMQADITRFANTWMQNIRRQQLSGRTVNHQQQQEMELGAAS